MTQRCDCGGTFEPNAKGQMRCNCCEAPMTCADVGAQAKPWTDIGKTLGEVLAHRRKQQAKPWVPTDDDVKVH